MKLLIAATLALLLTAGCAESETVPSGEDPRITERRNLVSTEFEREVLADGKINEQEYETSRQLYRSCMEERGYSVEFRDDGGSTIGAPGPETTTEDFDADDADCETGTTLVIAVLYETIRANPDNVDRMQQVVDCLKRNEIVPEGYTKDDVIAAGDSLYSSAQTEAVDGCWEDPLNYVAPELDRATSTPAIGDDS